MFPTVYLLGAIVLLVCLYAALWCITRHSEALTAHLPGWPTLPFIGNMHQLLGDSEHLFRCINELSKMADKSNSMTKLRFGPKLVLIMVKPEDIKAVTNAFIEKPYYYKFGRAWLGNGLVTASGAVWKKNIKKLASTFTGSVVDGFQDVFNYHALKLVEKLTQEVDKAPFDVMHKYLAFSTLETICQTAMGVTNISGSITTSEYYDAFNRALELMIKRGFNVLLYPDLVYQLTPNHLEFKRCIKILHNVSNTVITKRREERAQQNKQPCSTTETKANFKTFLDILLELSEADESLTDEQIRAEVDTVIVGGQETTASTLQFALLMLGAYPDVQHKLHSELAEIFGTNKRAVEKEDLSRMRYCEAVINESLRLFPPVPVVMRYADSDLHLDGCTVPAGTSCAISAWGAGRSSAWGTDAAQFLPERWLGERELPHAAAFAAFSYGRRSCIGKKYAAALLKTILAQCVRQFIFKSEAQKLEFKVDIALRPTCGHLLQVRLRNDATHGEGS